MASNTRMLSPGDYNHRPKLTSTYTFNSIIDIYNLPSPNATTTSPTSHLPTTTHTQTLHHTRHKISTLLQTYLYNLTPHPWSPPTIYLHLHRTLEDLEDLLHQLGNYDIDADFGVLGFVTHGLCDLLQEMELLLMGARVDGNRNEAWWGRFEKGLKEVGGAGGGKGGGGGMGGKTMTGEMQFRNAAERVGYYVWAAKWVLRVTVRGDFTRRITVAGNMVEKMLVEQVGRQVDLYVWDGGDGEEDFDIRNRFAEMAEYQGKCFVQSVKLEAAIRVWMSWAHKATIAFQHLPLIDLDSVPTKPYLNLLKAGWIFKLIHDDPRLDETTDEARAVVALVCSDLVYTLKLLLEAWLPTPDLADLISEGDWKIIPEEGFEEWEIEMELDHEVRQELKRVNSHNALAQSAHSAKTPTAASHSQSHTQTEKPLPPPPPQPRSIISQIMSKDIQGDIMQAGEANDFRYSPIIMRSDDEDSPSHSPTEAYRTMDAEKYVTSATITTPHLAMHPTSIYGHMDFAGSHASVDSVDSVYSVSSYGTFPSIQDEDGYGGRSRSSSDASGVEGGGGGFKKNSMSPDLRMSPSAAPGASYEMYEMNPYDTEDDGVSVASNSPPSRQVERFGGAASGYGNGAPGYQNEYAPSRDVGNGRREESPERSYGYRSGSNHHARSISQDIRPTAGSGPSSRFQDHLSFQLPPKPTTGTVPLSARLPLTTSDMKRTRSAERELPSIPQGQYSPLPLPPPITDPNNINGKASPDRFPPGRFPRAPPPVGGTMSSAGGRPISASVKGPAGIHAIPPSILTSSSPPTKNLPPPTGSETILPGGTLMVAGAGLAAKESSSRVIPAPLQLTNKKHHHPGHSISKALKTARADRHEKGGWGSLLTPMSGNVKYNDGTSPLPTPGVSSAGLVTSRRIESPGPGKGNGLPPVQPLTVASGALVALNKEAPRNAITKEQISSPTPAGMMLSPTPEPPPKPIETSSVPPSKPKKPRQIKNTAARKTAESLKFQYDARPEEHEILPTEFSLMGALCSDTGLPGGRWDECVIRLFRNSQNGKFRIVTFRAEGVVDEEFIDPAKVELVPEYAHHVGEIVPIIFIRSRMETDGGDAEEKEKEKKRRSARSSFGCVGQVNGSGNGGRRLGNAESFYYRFRRLDDMFNFQMAWTGEIVQTDIQSVKSIRYKKGFVGSESITGKARVQIWLDKPNVHEAANSKSDGSKKRGSGGGSGRNSPYRIVLYWDEVICTMFVSENLDIEAKPKSQTLKLKASRHSFNHPIQAKIFGQPSTSTTTKGQITPPTSGAVTLGDKDTAGGEGGFSDEAEFDDFKWFEIEFFEQEEMKWFYQDFMQAQKERMRGMRGGAGGLMGGGESGQEGHRKQASVGRI